MVKAYDSLREMQEREKLVFKGLTRVRLSGIILIAVDELKKASDATRTRSRGVVV